LISEASVEAIELRTHDQSRPLDDLRLSHVLQQC